MQQKLPEKEDRSEATDIEPEQGMVDLVVEEHVSAIEKEVRELILEGSTNAEVRLNECIAKLKVIEVSLKELAREINEPIDQASDSACNSSIKSRIPPCLRYFRFTKPPTHEDFVYLKKIAIQEKLPTSKVSLFLSDYQKTCDIKGFYCDIPDFNKLLEGEFDWEMYDAIQKHIAETSDLLVLKNLADLLKKQKLNEEPLVFMTVIASAVDENSVTNWNGILCSLVDYVPKSTKILVKSPTTNYNGFSDKQVGPFDDFLAKIRTDQEPTTEEYREFWKRFKPAYLKYVAEHPTHFICDFLSNSNKPYSKEDYKKWVKWSFTVGLYA